MSGAPGSRWSVLLRTLGFFVLAGVACAGGLFVYLPHNQGPRVSSPVAIGVDGSGSYVWILRSRTGAVLVDTGQDTGGEAILAELGRMGLGAADVRGVLLTHAHIDHVGGLHLFPGAELRVGAAEIPFLEGDPGGVWSLGAIALRLLGPPPKGQAPIPVVDGERFEIDGLAFQAVHLPGHTAGSTAWLHGDLLLAGDAALVSGGVVRIGPGIFNHDSGEATRSLELLKAVPFRDMADGHVGFTPSAKDLL